jgi:hypothetical protein
MWEQILGQRVFVFFCEQFIFETTVFWR